MKDLYRRNFLKPYESDQVKIHSSGGYDEDQTAAFAVLLDARRKAEYDRVHRALIDIGYIRAHCDIQNTDWRRRYADFVRSPDDPLPGNVNTSDGSEDSFSSAPGKSAESRGLMRLAGVVGMVTVALAALISLWLWPDDEGIPAATGPVQHYVAASQVSQFAEPDPNARTMGQLSHFDDVWLDPAASDAGWAAVSSALGEGYVMRQYLAAGNGRQAFLADCRQRGGQPPAPGNINQFGSPGEHTLLVANPPGKDAFVKLRTRQNETVLSFYIKADSKLTIDSVPEGSYYLDYVAGREFAPACELFLDDPTAYREPRTFHFRTASVNDRAFPTTISIILRSEIFNLKRIPIRGFSASD